MTFPPKWEGESHPVAVESVCVFLECAGYRADCVPKNELETQFIKELCGPQQRELKFHIQYPNDAF